MSMPGAPHTPHGTNLDQMRSDSVLPPDVRPANHFAPWAANGPVLLTGATGFVGAHLLHTLLRETTSKVVCLVRPDRRNKEVNRIRANLESHGLWQPAWQDRIRQVDGDLRRPGLGLTEQQQALLAEEVEVIFHAAAAVDWVRPYAGIRATNVQGTVELLRLACRSRVKPFHFLSTLGVCYATGAVSRMLTEKDDTWPLLGQLHLGYAQSKSVAEQLIRQARERGLPAVIYRPTMVTGDSLSGAANPDDFLSRGIGACVRMGCAPDVDWSIAACPVDHVARGVVRFAASCSGNNGEVLHFQHPRPRHWRELVLWMRLRGYPVRLVSYQDWLRRLEHSAEGAENPLHGLLDFFRTSVDGLTLPETYLGSRRSGVNDEWTRATLTGLGETCPTLDALWLERFFASLTTHGLISPMPDNGRQAGEVSLDPSNDELPALMRQYFDDPELHVRPAGPAKRLSEQSILTELTSWQHGADVGLFRHSIELVSTRESVPRRLQVVAKVRTDDQDLLKVVVATVGDRAISQAFDRWHGCLGFANGHLREIALYGQHDDRWRRFTPIVYGAVWDEERRRGLIVLEDLSENTWMDSGTGTDIWPGAWVEATVRGLAELHAVWFERGAELSEKTWLGSVFTAARMGEMADLWTGLSAHAARFFVPWLGREVRHLQRRLLSGLEDWWRPLEQMPHTLIHNDCNPRNLAIRHHKTGPQLCAFDWELATIAVPQHDLAEFLCFVLPINCPRQTVQRYLDLHRNALEVATNCRISADDWNHGFGLALADLLINRWAMYTLAHSVRRQPFLERVLHTWRRLYAYYDPLK